MAIKKFPGRALPFRVYWRNPFSGRIQSRHFLTLREAEKHDSLVKHWIRFEPERLRPADEPAPDESPTVESVVVAHLRQKQLAPKSLRETVYHVRPIIEAIGSVRISELKKAHLRDVVAGLQAKGLRQNTIQRKVAILKAALNWAEETELIEANPVRAFSCPRGSDLQIPPPTVRELETMISVAPDHVRRVIILGLAFGIRIGQSELFRIQWSQVDFGRRVLLVWSADKNQKAQWRELKIKDDLVGILAKWASEDESSRADDGSGFDYLIHWKGRPVKSIKRAWSEAKAKAGITRRIRPYDLRHAHATQAIAAGADVKAVSENMGHATTTMIFRHYQHVLTRQRDQAIELVPSLVIQDGHTSGHILDGFGITDEKNIQ